MPGERGPNPERKHLVVYQITIKGQLGGQWAAWFEGMTLTAQEDGATLISGPVVDQAALYGLLRKVRDLGLPLLSVIRVKAGKEDVIGANRSTMISQPDQSNPGREL